MRSMISTLVPDSWMGTSWKMKSAHVVPPSGVTCSAIASMLPSFAATITTGWSCTSNLIENRPGVCGVNSTHGEFGTCRFDCEYGRWLVVIGMGVLANRKRPGRKCVARSGVACALGDADIGEVRVERAAARRVEPHLQIHRDVVELRERVHGALQH